MESRPLTYTHVEYPNGHPITKSYCCRTGYELWTLYDGYIDKPFVESKRKEIYHRLFLKCEDGHMTNTSHKGNGAHQGLFAGTLTMSPNDGLNEEDMVSAIAKIFSQQTVPVKNWAWYREYTKNGLPHIHFCYETESGGRIHKKIFQRYWKIWDEPRNQTGRGGFPGGYHSPAKSETAYLEYISKDGGRRGFKGFKLENEILQTDK